MKKRIKIFFTILFLFTCSIIIVSYAFMNQLKFGANPSGKLLEKIKSSPNYRNGAFQNLEYTPSLSEGIGYWDIFNEMIFKRNPHRVPKAIIPSVKTNLLDLNIDEDVLIWFGHSSYFMQIDGRRILVDPVLSGSASPIASLMKSFKGSDIFSYEDIPSIDFLLITHDHWDHLDYHTLMALQPKIKKIICPLGVSAHLLRWKFDKAIIIEKDWNEKVELEKGFEITTIPTRHFSGRGIKRNQTLWTAYILNSPSKKIYIGGDGGYDNTFKKVGIEEGPFDLVILENGQYDKKWKYIHMLPEEVVKASIDLKAKKLFPVHSSKFPLANHAWNEPLSVVSKFSEEYKVSLITPKIGEKVNLNDSHQTFSQWWVTEK